MVVPRCKDARAGPLMHVPSRSWEALMQVEKSQGSQLQGPGENSLRPACSQGVYMCRLAGPMRRCASATSGDITTLGPERLV